MNTNEPESITHTPGESTMTTGEKILAQAMSPVEPKAISTTCQCGCIVVFKGSRLVKRMRCQAHQ